MLSQVFVQIIPCSIDITNLYKDCENENLHLAASEDIRDIRVVSLTN